MDSQAEINAAYEAESIRVFDMLRKGTKAAGDPVLWAEMVMGLRVIAGVLRQRVEQNFENQKNRAN